MTVPAWRPQCKHHTGGSSFDKHDLHGDNQLLRSLLGSRLMQAEVSDET